MPDIPMNCLLSPVESRPSDVNQMYERRAINPPFGSNIYSIVMRRLKSRSALPSSLGAKEEMLGLVAGALILVAFAAFLVKFATSDGDFSLTSRGQPKREEVEGKVVWITGASRGIGEVLANQFASLGAKVILSARSTAELERVKSEIISKFPLNGVEVLPMDLASGEQSLKEAVLMAESMFSGAGIDFMVHNAAFERPKRKALEETEEGLRGTMEINVLGTITLTQLLAPCMLRRGRGHFVVMSSAAGKCPSPGQALYSASKHALNGYFHTLRSELCQKGIKVTVICPGPIETSKSSQSNSSRKGGSSEKRVSSERCAELTIIAATHGLKEAWISYQPVLFVMYLVQYMPTIGYWFMDRIGANRLDAAASKKSAYSWSLMFGHKKSA